MSKFNSARAIIDEFIRKNGQGEITGEVLNNVLHSMLDDVSVATDSDVTKDYVDTKTAEAQAAAEQYIQNEVLTAYATTKYVEGREEYLVGYAEGLVNTLESDIDGRGYLTSAAMDSYATKEDIKGFVTKGEVVNSADGFDSMGKPNIMGYSSGTKGWKGTGPAMIWGTSGYYTRLNVFNENTDDPQLFISNVYANQEKGWAKIITDKNIASYSIALDSNGKELLPTDTKAKASYVYGGNGWKVAGPAMIFPHGGYSGLFNFGAYNPTAYPTHSPSLFININYGGVLGQWAQVVTDKNFDTFGVKVGGRETTGSANDIETPSIVGYTNGMTDTPFTYGTLFTLASNPNYYAAQLAIRANGIFAYRARNDLKVWTDWKTVVDSSNINDFALPKTGGTITGNLTVNGFIYGSVPSGSDLPGYVIVKNGNSLIIQATQGNVNNKDGNIILGGYGVPAQVIKLESILTYLTGDLTVIGGITLNNKKISSWDEIGGSGSGGSDCITSNGGTINAGKYLKFGTNASLGVASTLDGYDKLVVSGLTQMSDLYITERLYFEKGCIVTFRNWSTGKSESISSFGDLKDILGLGSLAYKNEADFVKVGGSYSTGSDLNDVKTAGIYTVYGGVTNAAASGSMITLASANPYYIGQITVKYNGEMYSRSFVPENGGVWSNWRTVIDSVNVGDYTLPKTGGVITGALTVKANFQANANILIEAGSIKFLSQGNIDGVGAIIHKYANAYNMDQYGNFYAPSDATDNSYWGFKRADGNNALSVYAGSGLVQTHYDTQLARYGGVVNMGNQWNRANTNVYGDFKVIGYPAEFQNGITLGGETIYSWADVRSNWAGSTQTVNSGETTIEVVSRVKKSILTTLTNSHRLTFTLNNQNSSVPEWIIRFKTGSSVPSINISYPNQTLVWQNKQNVLSDLKTNTEYRIYIDGTMAMYETF